MCLVLCLWFSKSRGQLTELCCTRGGLNLSPEREDERGELACAGIDKTTKTISIAIVMSHCQATVNVPRLCCLSPHSKRAKQRSQSTPYTDHSGKVSLSQRSILPIIKRGISDMGHHHSDRQIRLGLNFHNRVGPFRRSSITTFQYTIPMSRSSPKALLNSAEA